MSPARCQSCNSLVSKGSCSYIGFRFVCKNNNCKIVAYERLGRL